MATATAKTNGRNGHGLEPRARRITAAVAPEPAPKSLYGKIAEVIAEVGKVAKNGKNDFHGYSYAEAEAFLEVVRTPLAERNVVLMPSIEEISEREIQTRNGGHSTITTVRVSFTFVDGDSEQMHECSWAGQGDDPGDKGLGKAYTNAVKTFLRIGFLIPTGGGDPEADREADERAQGRGPSQARQPSAAAAKPSDRAASAAQRKMLRAKARDAGLSIPQFANVIKTEAGEDPIEWSSPEAAERWLDRAIDRLPARLVDGVIAGIAHGAAEGSQA